MESGVFNKHFGVMMTSHTGFMFFFLHWYGVCNAHLSRNNAEQHTHNTMFNETLDKQGSWKMTQATTEKTNTQNGDIWKSWIKKSNVAEYGGANWGNEVKRVTDVSLEQAMSIGEADPNISFFFYMRQFMNLGDKGNFEPNEAVFFSGEPWYGSAPQADSYEKATYEWVQKPNVAEYGGADWGNEVKRVSNVSLEEAQAIGEKDPNITFFFYMRQPMVLTGKGTFNPKDAVFFSGAPWYGSAPQADSYEKAIIRWSKKPNVAEYGGADWGNEVQRVSGVTLEQAMKIGASDSRVTFFFYMRQSMVLTGKGEFKPKDAVFFSGKPWYGSAPQADAYEKQEYSPWKSDSN